MGNPTSVLTASQVQAALSGPWHSWPCQWPLTSSWSTWPRGLTSGVTERYQAAALDGPGCQSEEGSVCVVVTLTLLCMLIPTDVCRHVGISYILYGWLNYCIDNNSIQSVTECSSGKDIVIYTNYWTLFFVLIIKTICFMMMSFMSSVSRIRILCCRRCFGNFCGRVDVWKYTLGIYRKSNVNRNATMTITLWRDQFLCFFMFLKFIWCFECECQNWQVLRLLFSRKK